MADSRGGIGEIHEAVEAEVFVGESHRLQGMAHAAVHGDEDAIRYWAKRKGLRLTKSRKDHTFGLQRDSVGVFCDPQTGYGKNLDEVADWLHDNVGHLPASDLQEELSRARGIRDRSGTRDG